MFHLFNTISKKENTLQRQQKEKQFAVYHQLVFLLCTTILNTATETIILPTNDSSNNNNNTTINYDIDGTKTEMILLYGTFSYITILVSILSLFLQQQQLQPATSLNDQTNNSSLSTVVLHNPVYCGCLPLFQRRQNNNNWKAPIIVQKIIQPIPPTIASLMICTLYLISTSQNDNVKEIEVEENSNDKKHILSEEQYVWFGLIYLLFFWFFRKKENKNYSLVRNCWNPTKRQSLLMQNTTHATVGVVEERKWYNWTNIEFLAWISSTMKTRNITHCNHSSSLTAKEDALQNQRIYQTVQPHEIDGSMLPYLTVQDWVHMGLSYKDAITVQTQIKELQTLHPSPSVFRATNCNTITNVNATIESSVEKCNDASGNSEIEMLSFDNNNHDRIKELMSERFGLQLPSLRTNDDDNEAQSCAPSNPTSIKEEESISLDIDAKIPNDSLQKIDNNNHHQLGPELLNSMPPNIREIASRRPGLVQTLLQYQQQQPQQQGATSALMGVVEEEEEEEDDDDDEDDEESTKKVHFSHPLTTSKQEKQHYDDNDDVDEMVGLLRKRRGNNSTGDGSRGEMIQYNFY